MIAKIEQTVVTNPVLDFGGSSCVIGDALRDILSLTGDSIVGADVDELPLPLGHILTSTI